MEIILDNAAQEFAEQRVASGEYPSVSDVVNAALRQFQSQKSEPDAMEYLGPFGRQDGGPRWTTETLRQAVQIGMDQADRGQFSKRSIEDIIAEGDRLASGTQGRK